MSQGPLPVSDRVDRYRRGDGGRVGWSELLSDGVSVWRRSHDRRAGALPGRTVAAAVANYPDLHEVRGGEVTSVTTAALVDELPLVLQAPATMPEDIEDPDQVPCNDHGEPVETYNDREVEVNGKEWSVSDGRAWGTVGLVNPGAVVLIWPNWAADGRRSVDGERLAAGITEYGHSFGVGGFWDLRLPRDVVAGVVDLVAGDEDTADLVAAAHAELGGLAP